MVAAIVVEVVVLEIGRVGRLVCLSSCKTQNPKSVMTHEASHTLQNCYLLWKADRWKLSLLVGDKDDHPDPVEP